MNDQTITEMRTSRSEESKNKDNTWVNVTLGGVGGILMGAGLLFGAQKVYAHADESEFPNPEPQNPETDPVVDNPTKPESEQPQAPTENPVEVHHYHHFSDTPQLAQIDTGLSFGEAFAAARAEVGPGGVFLWHGGVYNTFTAEEWNDMSQAERNAFAQNVPVSVKAVEIQVIPTDSNPEIEVDLTEQIEGNFDLGDDVHIVGLSTGGGDYLGGDNHLQVHYDTNQDDQADLTIIDVDDNLQITDDDYVVDHDGYAYTVKDLLDEGAPSDDGIDTINDPYNDDPMLADNPDVAPDMPDYMNDALA